MMNTKTNRSPLFWLLFALTALSSVPMALLALYIVAKVGVLAIADFNMLQTVWGGHISVFFMCLLPHSLLMCVALWCLVKENYTRAGLCLMAALGLWTVGYFASAVFEPAELSSLPNLILPATVVMALLYYCRSYGRQVAA